MKNNFIFITIFSVIYLSLSFILYQNVSEKNPHRDIDSVGYEKMAVGQKHTISGEQKSVVCQQPFGYPLFMRGVYKVFGQEDFYLIWVQIFLMLISGIILFFATKHIFGNLIALITFALFSINVGHIVFAQFILSEALLVFFLILFFERFFYFLKFLKIDSLFLSGLFLGASTWIKPAALYYIFPFLIIFIPFIFSQKKLSIYKKVLIPLLFAFAFFIPVKSNLSGFKSLGNYNLFVWFWSKVETDKLKIKDPKLREKVFFEQQKKLASFETNLKNKFFESFFKTPFLFIKTWIREMIKTFFGLYTTNLKLLTTANVKEVSFSYTSGPILSRIFQYIEMGTESKIIKFIGLLEFAWNLLKYFLVLIALLFLLRLKKYFLLFFLTSYISYFSFVTGFDGCARYRTMFEFVLLILASAGIYFILHRNGEVYGKKTINYHPDF